MDLLDRALPYFVHNLPSHFLGRSNYWHIDMLDKSLTAAISYLCPLPDSLLVFQHGYNTRPQRHRCCYDVLQWACSSQKHALCHYMHACDYCESMFAHTDTVTTYAGVAIITGTRTRRSALLICKIQDGNRPSNRSRRLVASCWYLNTTISYLVICPFRHILSDGEPQHPSRSFIR